MNAKFVKAAAAKSHELRIQHTSEALRHSVIAPMKPVKNPNRMKMNPAQHIKCGTSMHGSKSLMVVASLCASHASMAMGVPSEAHTLR